MDPYPESSPVSPAPVPPLPGNGIQQRSIALYLIITLVT